MPGDGFLGSRRLRRDRRRTLDRQRARWLTTGDETCTADRDVGTGKSTVVREFAARGYKAVDTDYDGLSELVDVPDDVPTGLDPGQDWLWREDRIQEILSTASTDDGDVLFLSGCSPNQGTFYPQFDHIVLLTAPADVIVERLATRTNNPYGKRPEEVARVLSLLQTIEPLLRRGATLEVDTSAPVEHVVETILDHVRPHGTRPG